MSWTLILCTLTTLLSISPWIEGGGLLPAAVVTLYSFYLAFSALASNPSSCNGLYGEGGSAASAKANVWQTVVNILISAASIGYAAYNVYTSSSLIGEDALDEAAPAPSDSYAAIEGEKKEEGKAAAAVDDEAGEDADGKASVVTDKQYRRFYLVMAVASMYVTQHLHCTATLPTHSHTQRLTPVFLCCQVPLHAAHQLGEQGDGGRPHAQG